MKTKIKERKRGKEGSGGDRQTDRETDIVSSHTRIKSIFLS